MNLKKFISGVSAFAIAASAFAAMAVNASATDYTDITPTHGKLINVADNENGTYAVAQNATGGVIVDFSYLTGIDNASSVTVDFDTKVPLISYNSRNYIPHLVYGVGDKSVRGVNGKGSGANNYVKDGLVTYFGSLDASTYKVLGDNGSDRRNLFGNKDVHASITLDRDNDKFSISLTPAGGSTVTIPNIATAVDNITVVEAFTWGSPAYDIKLSDVKVSYTVPDEPTVTKEISAREAFTTPEYDTDMVVGIFDLDVTGGSYDLSNATYKGNPGSVSGAQSTSVSGPVRIAVVINNETDTDALDAVAFE